jgi:hypothetical protein
MAYLTGGGAFYPLQVPRTITTIIPTASLSTATTFTAAGGYITLKCVDSTTGYTFSFGLKGKFQSPQLLPTSNSVLFALPATAVGCTVTPETYVANQSTTVQVVTPGGDSGGRTYLFTFFVATSLKPTIQLIAGTALATSLQVISLDVQYGFL